MAYESLSLIQDEFNNSVDPFSSPWTPLKRPTHKILIDTGKLKQSFRVISIQEDSFEIENTTPYASYHQFGTDKIPQRMILPINEIPDKWAAAFVKILIRDMKEDLGDE